MVSISPGLMPMCVLPGSMPFTASAEKVTWSVRALFSMAIRAVMILVVLAGYLFSSIPLA